MAEIAKDVVGRLETFLRAIAPGFVLLLALAMAEAGRSNRITGLFSPHEWLGIGVGVLLGFLSYSLHYALLEDWLMRIVIYDTKRSHPQDVPDALKTLAACDVIPILSRERWARMGSDHKKTVALQTALNGSYSWLIFLYCSGYLLLAGAIWLCFNGHSTALRISTVTAAGILFVLAAIVADTKITRHEMFIAKMSPQLLEAADLTGKERPNKSPEPTPTAVTPRANE